jgi:hypothetical protein
MPACRHVRGRACPAQVQTTRACPTHVWRRRRPRRGDGRGTRGISPAAAERLRALVPPSSQRWRTGMAGRPCVPGAGEGQPRPSWSPSVRMSGAGARPLTAQGSGRPGLGAETRARTPPLPRPQPALGRLLPAAARKAAGGPAPRPDAGRTWSSAPAGSRGPRSAAARARGGAGTVKACPGPRWCPTRARDGRPAGVWRRHRRAAAETAPGRFGRWSQSSGVGTRSRVLS